MKRLTVILVVVSLLFACQNRKPKLPEFQTESISEQEMTQSIKKVMGKYHSMDQVVRFIDSSQCNFNTDVLHNAEMVDSYMHSPFLMAANIGIYNWDAIYQVSYNQTEGAKKSRDAAYQLAEKIGIGEWQKKHYYLRFNVDYIPRDSIISRLKMAIDKSDNQFIDKEKGMIIYCVLAGSYIEKFHLLLHIYDDANSRTDFDEYENNIQEIILNQKEQIQGLLIMGRGFIDSNFDGPFIEGLDQLLLTYNEIDANKAELTEQQKQNYIKDITSQIAVIRSKVTRE